jgi:hypothetical protein
MSYFDIVLDGSDTHPRRLTLKLLDSCGLSAWMFTQATLELLAFATAPVKYCRLAVAPDGLVLHIGVAQFNVSDLEGAQILTKLSPLGLISSHSPVPPFALAPVLEATAAVTPPDSGSGAASVTPLAGTDTPESQHTHAVAAAIRMSEGY